MTQADAIYLKLSRPPLREALIDLRLSQMLPPIFLNRIRSLSLPDYATPTEIKQGAFKITIGPGHSSSANVISDEVCGLRFQASDNSEVLQFRRNGFTFSKLKNYSNWEDLRQTAEGFWRRFVAASGPATVDRIAVRYINAIDVPTGVDFDEYLRACPRIPEGLPQLLTSFLQRVVVPFAEVEAHAIITQAFEPVGTASNSFTVVVDIDVFKQISLDSESPEIWRTLSKLRDIKNRIFFSSLTDRALEVYR